MLEREELLKEEENRKKNVLESIRKKEEMRKQMQVETYKKRLEEESRRAEETEKRRQEKAEERKRALEEWHKQKQTKGRHGSIICEGGEKHKKKNRPSKLDVTEFKTNNMMIMEEGEDPENKAH